MKKDNDIFFKLGLGLQLLLIPVAFLYHFSSEDSNFNWVLSFCLVLVILLFFWPQTIIVRAKRLKAIKLQFLLVIIMLALTWLLYGFLHHYARTHCSLPFSMHWQGNPNSLFHHPGKSCNFNPPAGMEPSMIRQSILPWFLFMEPGISLLTAGLVSVVFLLFPFANYYRYSLDKKRIKGIRKTDLFN